MNKKVSIIIPCYNQGKYINESIESALSQTYKNIEIVCVDDCSTDNSAEIIRNLAKNHNNLIFIAMDKNQGVVNVRNLAIERSSGEYILPLDGDDTIEPTYVEKAVEILDNNPEIGIVYCRARKFGNKNKVWELPEFNVDEFIYECSIFNCSLYRKTDF